MHRSYLLPVFLVATCLSLSACNGVQRSAEAAVTDRLKDPESARFGEFYYNAKLKRACLTVNAKNSMGGYTGDKQVALERTDDGWEWIYDIEESPERCRKSWADDKQEKE